MLKIFSPTFIFFVGILLIVIIIYFRSSFECKNFIIRHFYINNTKNDAKSLIIYLSDFHNKIYDSNNSKLLNEIFKINPDYIVLGGDFIDFSALSSKLKRVGIDNTISFIDELVKKFDYLNENRNCNLKQIFFSYGNHELRLKRHIENTNEMKLISAENLLNETIVNNNIYILDNSSYVINDNISIYGLSVYDGYYHNVFSKFKKKSHIDKSLLTNLYPDINFSNYNIMLFHTPDYCEDLIDFGFDLVLSGHNHGGLIKFPIIGAIFSPDLNLFPKYNSGEYIYKNGHVIVSAGLGEHILKLRLNNRPDICCIHIE